MSLDFHLGRLSFPRGRYGVTVSYAGWNAYSSACMAKTSNLNCRLRSPKPLVPPFGHVNQQKFSFIITCFYRAKNTLSAHLIRRVKELTKVMKGGVQGYKMH